MFREQLVIFIQIIDAAERLKFDTLSVIYADAFENCPRKVTQYYSGNKVTAQSKCFVL